MCKIKFLQNHGLIYKNECVKFVNDLWSINEFLQINLFFLSFGHAYQTMVRYRIFRYRTMVRFAGVYDIVIKKKYFFCIYNKIKKYLNYFLSAMFIIYFIFDVFFVRVILYSFLWKHYVRLLSLFRSKTYY